MQKRLKALILSLPTDAFAVWSLLKNYRSFYSLLIHNLAFMIPPAYEQFSSYSKYSYYSFIKMPALTLSVTAGVFLFLLLWWEYYLLYLTALYVSPPVYGAGWIHSRLCYLLALLFSLFMLHENWLPSYKHEKRKQGTQGDYILYPVRWLWCMQSDVHLGAICEENG